jgi:hypothetical protein
MICSEAVAAQSKDGLPSTAIGEIKTITMVGEGPVYGRLPCSG